MNTNTIRQMFRRDVVLLSLFASLLLFAATANAMVITFDNEVMGTQYGSPAGHMPGDYIFTEDSADLIVDEFILGGPWFNFLQIDPASSYFGVNKIMELNNADVVVDFTAPGDATFDFAWTGGSVNLEVNGNGVDVPTEPLLYNTNPAPGVNLNVINVAPIPGGYKGQVVLAGPVEKLRIGGQEYWIDRVTCANGIGTSPGHAGDCDYLVSHTSLPVGTVYDSSSYSAGDWIFNEDGIDVYLEEITWSNGGTYLGYCEVDAPVFPNFGDGRTMLINNVSNRYDIAGLGIHTSEVKFEYVDMGGAENLQVNGSTLFVDDFTNFPALVAPGVVMTLNTYPISGGVRAEVVLTGDIQELVVGGQEFWIDEICVIEGDAPVPNECEYLVDYESQLMGTEYSAATGYSAGDMIFMEDNIPVVLTEITWTSGGTYLGEATIVSAFSATGDANAINLNNIGNLFDISALGMTVEKVTFEFVTYGGEENMLVNGSSLFVGDLESAQ